MWRRRESDTAHPQMRGSRAGLSGAVGSDGYTEIAPDDVVRALHELTGWAMEHGARLDGLQVTRSSLEDVYLSLTDAQSKGDSRPDSIAAQAAGD
jgi:hypothetical protein